MKRNLKLWRKLASSKKCSAFAAFFLIVALATVTASDAMTSVSKYKTMLNQHERVPAEFVVRVKRDMSAKSLEAIFSKNLGVASVRAFETHGDFFRVTLQNDKSSEAFLAEANANAAIAYAEPNYILRLVGNQVMDEVVPNDPQFNRLWGLKNEGQSDSSGQAGVAGADISATKAWAVEQGSREILVAVIDTGVDYTHPDLAANIAYNMGEYGDGKESNGIDDDGNGFVDDFRGWNFAGVSNNNPMDDNNHGTHCSGTIGAVGNDGNGIAGVAWNVGIVPVKFLTGAGSGTLADAVSAIQYATIRGVDIMSNSWGGGGFTQSMFDAITEAKEAGILFVAAAGNDGRNTDANPAYPAGYQIENVISVAATDNRDTAANFSNFGKRTVHIAAPGKNVYSTIPGNSYASYSGTSMATPHVSGAAALTWAAHREESFAELKERLLKSVDWKANLARTIASSGRLNVYNAVMGIYPTNPEPDESAWMDDDRDYGIETDHPHADNMNQEWIIEGPANAKHVRLVFSRLELEARYDFLRVYDMDGNELDAITGMYPNGVSSWYANGRGLRIVFTSDGSVVNWGFKLEKLQYIPNEE